MKSSQHFCFQLSVFINQLCSLPGETDQSDQILRQLEDGPLQREIRPGVVVNLEQPDEYDSETVKAQALANVQSAFIKHEEKVHPFSTIRSARAYLMTKELSEKGVGVKYLAQELEETIWKVEWVFGYRGIGWGWGINYNP